MLFRVLVGLAALVIVTTTGLRLASAASVEVIAHCCCGDHSVDDDCHCPDCPADRADRGRQGPTQTTLDRCYVEGSSELMVLLPVFDRVASVAVIGPRSIWVPRFEAPGADPAPTLAPPYEPPR